MRELIFRGKTVDNGVWVEGFYVRLYDDKGNESHRIYTGYAETDCGDYYPDWFEVDPNTVSQYTGLKDKNGKKIFEGDIIKYAFQHDYDCYIESLVHPEYYDGSDFSNIFEIDKVVYCSEWGYPAFDLDKQPFDCNSLSELSESMEYHFEVIGNIHDDKELLEEI